MYIDTVLGFTQYMYTHIYIYICIFMCIYIDIYSVWGHCKNICLNCCAREHFSIVFSDYFVTFFVFILFAHSSMRAPAERPRYDRFHKYLVNKNSERLAQRSDQSIQSECA